MKKSLYFIRHGETEFNRLGIIQGSGVDSELNAKGKEQAQKFFNHYQHIDFELVFTSRLVRTHQTVSHFLDKSIPWIQDAAINEMNWGIHEGKPSSPQLREDYRNMIAAWSREEYDFKLTQGESATELYTRTRDFLERLVERPEKNILICSHGRTLRCINTLLRDEPLHQMEKYKHKNTSLTFATYLSSFDVHLTNDISHLKS